MNTADTASEQPAASLGEILCAEILQHGPVPFERFMELALYHPALGYYEQEVNPVGRGGDFITSVSVGSLFGELLGFRFARWLEDALPDGAVQIVEAGAGDGRLARDLLEFVRVHAPALAGRLRYLLIEPSDRRRRQQERTLAGFRGQLQWASAWNAVPPVRGVIFSNELLDALPVCVWRWDAETRSWREWGVGLAGTRLAWMPLSAVRELPTPAVPAGLAATLPHGYTVETSPATVAWWRAAAEHLDAGWLVTCDYGDAPEERFPSARHHGTLRAYHAHQPGDSVLDEPGTRDLTAHVDFGAIQAEGERNGLRTAGFWRQESFLNHILRDLESRPHDFPAWNPARLRQLRTLTHPAHFGHAFKVLVQTRGVG